MPVVEIQERRWVRENAAVSLSTGYRLASLADGEGCFYIGRVKTGYLCQFIVAMRVDDRPFLEFFQKETGLGRVTNWPACGPSNPKARWTVTKKKELLALTEIFDEYPLISKKARDYAIWREAVIDWNCHGPGDSWNSIAKAHDQLRAVREFDDPATRQLP